MAKTPRNSEARKARVRRFVSGMVSGKSMRKAALEAGYPQSMADKPGATIMPSARQEFLEALRKRIPIHKITRRLAEGLDANNVKVFMHEGAIQYSRPLVDFSERRQASETAARLMELDPTEKIELDAGGAIEVVIREIGKGKPEQTPEAEA